MPEFRLFDAPGSTVAELTTDGETFKPFVTAIEEVDDEVRIHVTEDGLSATIVDPANVFMADVHLDASAFDNYTVENESTLGVNVNSLKSLIRRARKDEDDELALSLRERELTATVSRGYENHDVVSQGTMDLIDPDSIRMEPDFPEMEWNATLEVDTKPFKDALSYAVGVSEHVEFDLKPVNQHVSALYLGGETDTREEKVAIDGLDTDAAARSLYSKNYMNSILEGITGVDAGEVAVGLDDEYPVKVEMESNGLSVDYRLAPRQTDT